MTRARSSGSHPFLSLSLSQNEKITEREPVAPAPLLSPPPCYSQANASLNTRWVCPSNFTRGGGGGRGQRGKGGMGQEGVCQQHYKAPRQKGQRKDGRAMDESWHAGANWTLWMEWKKIQSGDGKGKMRPSRWFINTDTHTNEVTGIIMWGAAWSKLCVFFYWFCMYNTLVVESWLNSELD